MWSIVLCALVLIALPAYAEWLPASSREVEGIEVERIRFTYSGKKLILNRMLRAAMRRDASAGADAVDAGDEPVALSATTLNSYHVRSDRSCRWITGLPDLVSSTRDRKPPAPPNCAKT